MTNALLAEVDLFMATAGNRHTAIAMSLFQVPQKIKTRHARQTEFAYYENEWHRNRIMVCVATTRQHGPTRLAATGVTI